MIDNILSGINEAITSNRAAVTKFIQKSQGFTFTTLFVLSAIQRLESNAHGFGMMVRERNVPVAGSVLRMQIDTAMRLHGLSLMRDCNDGVISLIRGERYDKIKSKSGKPLKDSVLLADLSRDNPWVERVYNRTSGMIHLSGTHIHHVLDHAGAKELDDGSLTIDLIISATGPDLPDHLFEEASEAFLQATLLASSLAVSFLQWEQSVMSNQNSAT